MYKGLTLTMGYCNYSKSIVCIRVSGVNPPFSKTLPPLFLQAPLKSTDCPSPPF